MGVRIEMMYGYRNGNKDLWRKSYYYGGDRKRDEEITRRADEGNAGGVKKVYDGKDKWKRWRGT